MRPVIGIQGRRYAFRKVAAFGIADFECRRDTGMRKSIPVQGDNCGLETPPTPDPDLCSWLSTGFHVCPIASVGFGPQTKASSSSVRIS